MPIDNLAAEPFIAVSRGQENRHVFDVELQRLETLRNYTSCECHAVLFPYSRKITDRHLRFTPYEDYVQDIQTQLNSAYVKISRHANVIFGILLGLLITLIFGLLKPTDLFTVQSTVAVLGAYFVGKELWDDIEALFVRLSKDWRLRYQQSYYAFKLERNSTLTLYSQFAAKNRYGKDVLLPELINFFQQRRSQTLRMLFNGRDIRGLSDTAHIFSIQISPEMLELYEREGALLGLKLSLNRRRFGVTSSTELFQSLHNGTPGCVDNCGRWLDGQLFYRRVLSIGKIRFVSKSGLLTGQNLIRQNA
jgi:hypothetical protein